jgi:hypothetical protein
VEVESVADWTVCLMGFSAISEFAGADELGQTWVTQFRKTVASAATATNGWIDYSYFAGSPAANFYASAPVVAAPVEASRGIFVPTVSPATQHLKQLTVMTANTGSAVNARQRLILCDYLMYYPFIDTDAVGEEQVMTNYPDVGAIQLPRYTSGRVIAVGQSASSAIGTFTFNYTNQDGVSGRVSPIASTYVIAGGGQLVSADNAGVSFNPYLSLQAGDSGVRSIESVTFTAPGGGLMALVIVKPLLNGYVTQESRGALGAADEFMSVIHSAGAPQIKDGAVLNFIAQGNGGSLASSQLVGTLETVWK